MSIPIYLPISTTYTIQKHTGEDARVYIELFPPAASLIAHSDIKIQSHVIPTLSAAKTEGPYESQAILSN